MVNRKAPVPSGVTSDALKSMIWTEKTPDNEDDNVNYQATVICAMILEIWEGTLDFEPWKSGTFVPVSKK
eukprot:8896494-Ditylum_brightwellii.AAC.1